MRVCELRVCELLAEQFPSCDLQLDQGLSCELRVGQFVTCLLFPTHCFKFANETE